jgi:hypothetical protein
MRDGHCEASPPSPDIVDMRQQVGGILVDADGA